MLKYAFALSLFGFLTACDTEDEENCTSCDLEGIEICEVEDGQIAIFENGERVGDLLDLPNEVSFDEAARQLCAEIERQVNNAGGCYDCAGPNVNDFTVCKTDEGITLSGELIPDTEDLSLQDAVGILEDNPNGDEAFEGLSCRQN